MRSHIEQLIAFFSEGQFGSEDPRTSSIASIPGNTLSFDNQAKILEAQMHSEKYLHEEFERGLTELRAYWSDEQHLAEKLHVTIHSVASFYHAVSEGLTAEFAIVRGTGQVVMNIDGKFHYVEIDTHDQNNPVYISDKAILPESEVQFLASAKEIGIYG